jgi:hypothetical protein
MSVWDKFNKLAKLDFDYEGVTPGKIPEIYANARNQLDIAISVEVRDSDDKPLNLKEEDFKDLIYFCDYITGEKLNSSWSISNNANDYTKPVTPSDYRVNKVISPGIIYINRYLSCSKSNIEKTFSVGINIPGIGDFNTSKNGTNTPNGPKGGTGSPFKFPKSLTISTLHPIDYNNTENIIITEGVKKFTDMKYVVENIKIRSGDFIIHEDYIGKSAYSSITIKTKKGHLLKNKNFKRNMVKIPGVNICGINNSADIACGRQRSHGYSWHWDTNNYDFTLIFIDSPKCGVSPNSSFHLISENWLKNYHVYYDVGSNDSRHELSPDNSSIPKIDSAYISLVICNYTIPNLAALSLWWEDGFEKEWNNAPSDGVVKINVFDEYGNSGSIRIKLDYEDRNYPKIIINDKLEFFN